MPSDTTFKVRSSNIASEKSADLLNAFVKFRKCLFAVFHTRNFLTSNPAQYALAQDQLRSSERSSAERFHMGYSSGVPGVLTLEPLLAVWTWNASGCIHLS